MVIFAPSNNMARVLIASALILSLLPGSKVGAANSLDDPCTGTCDNSVLSGLTCDMLRESPVCKYVVNSGCTDDIYCLTGAACLNITSCQCVGDYVEDNGLCKKSGVTTLAVSGILLTLSVIVGLSSFSMAPF